MLFQTQRQMTGANLLWHKLVLMFKPCKTRSGGCQKVGLISSDEISLVDSAINVLCASLRPDVIALTDAFDFGSRVMPFL